MSSLLLYTVTAGALSLGWSRGIRRMSRAAAIALILLPLLFTGRALLTGGVYGPADLPYLSEPLKDYASLYGVKSGWNGTISDLYCQIMPWRAAVRFAISRGEWPLLNPFMLCGDILAAAAQPAPYDPVNLLSLAIPLHAAITYSAAMTFFLAGFFAFGFVRLTGRSELASIVAAAVYLASELIAFNAGWPLGRAWAFFPLVLAAVRLLVDEPGVRATGILTAAFVVTILSGHPESLLHIASAGALYGLFALASRDARRRALRAIGAAVAAGALALLLTAIFLLPFLEAVPQTAEFQRRAGQSGSAYWFDSRQLERTAAPTFVPFYGGQPWRGGSTGDWGPLNARVGSIAIALAALAIALRWRERETIFWTAMLAATLDATFGAPPITPLLRRLPLFAIAINERLAFVAAMAFAVLAAIGIDASTEAVAVRERRRTGIIVAAAVFVTLAAATLWLAPGQIAAGVPRALVIAFSAAELVPLAVLAGMIAFRLRPLTIAAAALAMLLAQRAVVDGSIYPTLPARAFYPRIPLLAAIPPADDESAGPYRMVAMHFGLIPDTAAMYHLEDARGYEAMTFSRLVSTYPLWCLEQPLSFNNVFDLSRPFLSAANIRYAISSKGGIGGEGWRLLKEDRQSMLWENTRVLPRAFVPRRIRYARSRSEVVLAMQEVRDFGELAFIETDTYPADQIDNGSGTLEVKREGLGLRVLARMQSDGWVVVSQSAWRGWRAYIDGRRVETHFADCAFIGVFVPRGVHTLRLVYLPESFTRGRAISFGTAAALALLWITRRVRMRASRGTGRGSTPPR